MFTGSREVVVGGGAAGLAPALVWQLGSGPPTPQLTTLRCAGLGLGNFSRPAEAGSEPRWLKEGSNGQQLCLSLIP